MGQHGVEPSRRFASVFEDSGGQCFSGTDHMHLGVVLYFMFRLEAFCPFSFQLHHGSDHPNRVFSDLDETWMAAAETSPADVKELIPEFLCCPDLFDACSSLHITTTTDRIDVRTVALARTRTPSSLCRRSSGSCRWDG
jgi:hypothetical protein